MPFTPLRFGTHTAGAYASCRWLQIRKRIGVHGEHLDLVPLDELFEIRCGHGRHPRSFRIIDLRVVVPGYPANSCT
jgi:hypothetical protein